MASTDPAPSPYDPKGETNAPRAAKPRDAATLILIRRDRTGPQVLMGQRAKGHVFMPDKWVFPGGRVDPADALAPAASELTEEAEADLKRESRRARPRAFPLAAIRETFEEAGLIVGRRGHAHGALAPRGWAEYCAHHAAPELDKLTFIARAITPPYRPRRFDARFFMADAEAVLLDDRPVAGDQELLHTRWFAMDEAMGLDLPNVTRFVLGEVQARLRGEALRPVFLRWVRGGHRMERL